MSKPGKVLRNLCKRLGVRLTVKRGKKRVYKSIKVLKEQCKRKQKKKKRKVKRRRRKFGASLVTNNTTDTSWIAPGQPFNQIKKIVDFPEYKNDTKFYIKYKGYPVPSENDVALGFSDARLDNDLLGPDPLFFSGIVTSSPTTTITMGRAVDNSFFVVLKITECPSRPELVGKIVEVYSMRDQISLYPTKEQEKQEVYYALRALDAMRKKSPNPSKYSEDVESYFMSFLPSKGIYKQKIPYDKYFTGYKGGYFGRRKRKKKTVKRKK